MPEEESVVASKSVQVPEEEPVVVSESVHVAEEPVVSSEPVQE